jgi:hypothetical protein
MPRVRLGAVIAVGLAAAFLTWLALKDDDGDRAAAQPAKPSLPSERELRKLSDSRDLDIHWAGRRTGHRVELTQTAGRVFVRYLPRGVELGDRRAAFLAVGTYAQDNAFAEVRAASRRSGAVALKLPGGGLTVYDRNRPTSIYLGYPDADYQVEVYHPDAATVRRLVVSGRVTPVAAAARSTAPSEVTEEELAALADFLQMPVHWAGPRPGRRYELTTTPEGRVYVRYLPRGAKVGDRRAAFLTVGTYPQRDGLATVRAAAKRAGAATAELRGGALAVYDRSRPTSVFVGNPGADYQIEVYHPDAEQALRLVVSGQIVPIG